MGMYAIDYVRAKQGDVEFTTARSSVTDDMTLLKDTDATDLRGNPLPPTTTSSDKKSGGKTSGSSSAASDEA